MSKWGTEVPPVGTVCLVKGIAHGDYGYTPDEKKTFRCKVLPPVEEDGEWYPDVQILEATPRYFNGFTPKQYMVIEDE